MTQSATTAPAVDRRAAFDAVCPEGYQALRDAHIATVTSPAQFAVAVLKLQKASGGTVDGEAIAKAADEHLWQHDAAIRSEYRSKDAFLAYRGGVRTGRIGGRRT